MRGSETPIAVTDKEYITIFDATTDGPATRMAVEVPSSNTDRIVVRVTMASGGGRINYLTVSPEVPYKPFGGGRSQIQKVEAKAVNKSSNVLYFDMVISED